MIKMFAWRRKWMIVLLFWVFLCPHASWVCAGEQTSPEANQEKGIDKMSPEIIKQGITETEKRLKLAESSENKQTAQQFGVSLSDLQNRTAKIQDIEAGYHRLLTALEKGDSLEKEETILRDKMKSFEKGKIGQKPPFSLHFYDDLLDQITAAEKQKETANLAIKLARRSLDNAGESLKEAEKNIRRLKEKLETAVNGEAQDLKWAFEGAQLERELAQVVFDFQKANSVNLSKGFALVELRENLARQDLRWVQEHISFDETDLQKQIDAITKERTRLQKRIKKLGKEQRGIEAAWVKSQKRVSNAKSEMEIALATATLKTREAWRNTYQRVLEQTEEMLQFLGQQEEIWKQRYALVKGRVDVEQLDRWEKEADSRLKNIERVLRLQQRYQTDWQSRMVSLEKKMSEEELNSRVKNYAQNQMKALEQSAEHTVEYMSTLLTTEQLHQRLLDEIFAKGEHIPLWDKLVTSVSKLQNFWSFELWVMDEHSVTVKKVIYALIVLIIGVLLIRFGIRITRRHLLPRTSLGASAAAAIEKMLYYFGL
ncbi:MAG: hypothetical protein U9N37_03555, partial [Thermodesulfobacteriota bacterium]|nr:hypothetical protein [Thermodesulfobacteriota bacterium]